MPVAVVPVAANPELPKGVTAVVSQPPTQYIITYASCQMVPSVPIHTYESNAFL